MRFGIAAKVDRIFPKYLAHLIWLVLFLIKHPSAVFRNGFFLRALRENAGTAYFNGAHSSFYKDYSQRRVGFADQNLDELFADYCTYIDLTKPRVFTEIPSRPFVDFCLVTPSTLGDQELLRNLEDIPLVLVLNETSMDHSGLDLSQISWVIDMRDKDQATGIDKSTVIAPDPDLLDLNRLLEEHSLDRDKIGNKDIYGKKLFTLLELGKRHHDHRLDLFEKLLKKFNYELFSQPKISVVAPTNRSEYIPNIIESFSKQSYQNKELVLVLHGIGKPADLKLAENIKLVECKKEEIFGDCLNKGAAASTGKFVAKFDDDDIYGEDHLYDLYYGWKQSGADIVGKWGHYIHMEHSNKWLQWHSINAENYCSHLPGGTILIPKPLFDQYKFGSVRNAIDSELLKRLKNDGKKLFSAVQYNYVRVRHQNGHTWLRDEQEFIDEADCEIDDSNIYELTYTNKNKLLKSIDELTSKIASNG